MISIITMIAGDAEDAACFRNPAVPGSIPPWSAAAPA